MLEYDELKVEFEGYEPELKELAGALDLDNLKTEIAKLEEQSAQPDFWNDVENSQKISQKQAKIRIQYRATKSSVKAMTM